MSGRRWGLANYLFCVHCGAKPGAPCRASSGVVRSPHADRIALAVDLMAGVVNPEVAKGLLAQAVAAGLPFTRGSTAAVKSAVRAPAPVCPECQQSPCIGHPRH